MSDSQDPFRFLDLPPELRLMVYKYLPNRTRCSKFTCTASSGRPTSTFKLISTSPPPLALLLTCRLVHQEAQGILKNTAMGFLEGDYPGGPAPRIEADVNALLLLTSHDGLIQNVITSYGTINQQRRTRRRYPGHSGAGAVTSLVSPIKAGAATDDIQEIDHFINNAVYALQQQRPSHLAQIKILYYRFFQIALNKSPEDSDANFVKNLAACMINYNRTKDHNKILAHIHLLKDTDTSLGEQKHVFRLAQSCMHYVFRGLNALNDTHSVVYNTLWKKGEWL